MASDAITGNDVHRETLTTTRKTRHALVKAHTSYLKKLGDDEHVGRLVKQPQIAEAYPVSARSIRDLELVRPIHPTESRTHSESDTSQQVKAG
jgi:hypothetical protein